jgi:hypothetical protein
VLHLNDTDELITRRTPELQIIDQELWDRVQDRMAAEAVGPRANPVPDANAPGFWDRRRPRYLLTCKVVCGSCGRPFAAVGKDYLACLAARNGGCPNTHSARRPTLEAQVLDALGRQLMRPDAVAEFIATFNAELSHLRAEVTAAADIRARELAGLGRRINNTSSTRSPRGSQTDAARQAGRTRSPARPACCRGSGRPR